jgi:hypothetical protein
VSEPAAAAPAAALPAAALSEPADPAAADPAGADPLAADPAAAVGAALDPAPSELCFLHAVESVSDDARTTQARRFIHFLIL